MTAAWRHGTLAGGDLAALAGDRAAAYGFLAAGLRPPGADLAVLLAEGDLAGPFAAVGLDQRARAVRSEGAKAAPVELNIEHTRLFGGPRPAAPPYESVYRDGDGLVMGRATVAVMQEYGAAGLVHEPQPCELPDHVAVELEFLSVLCEEEAAAWAANIASEARRWLEREQGFLQRHCLLWFPTFAGQASAAGPHPFYRALLELAGAFLARDEACLGGLRRLVAEEFVADAGSGATDA